ncbi:MULTISPECIES: DUF5131 family protein [unclassified Streptomyces]|uniref:DUF5131 family protein n=1 Tax=unclassified Streptomyces TaxID=2593676 RepID=UPI003318E021
MRAVGRPGTGRHRLVIADGESGPGHRPLEETWVTQMRDACQEAQMAFFVKLLCTKPSGPRSPGIQRPGAIASRRAAITAMR